MTALAKDRNTRSKFEQRTIYLPVIASDIIYKGALVAVNIAGNAKPASALVLGDQVVGVADEQVDNSGGSAGDLSVRVSVGVFSFVNSSTNPITILDHGRPVYVEDDQTVADEKGGANVIAGLLDTIDENDQVWIYVAPGQQPVEGLDEVVASGAISIYTRTTRLTVADTKAYTLANGIREGQRKTIYCEAVSGTPDGTITPATLDGGTTLDVDAVSESYELEYHDTGGWHVVHLIGGAIS